MAPAIVTPIEQIMLRTSIVRLAYISVFLAMHSCAPDRELASRDEYVANPAAEADFRRFVVESEPVLREALTGLGYQEAPDADMFRPFVSKLRPVEVEAGIAEASLGVWVASPEFDYATPEHLALEFVRPGAEVGWYLLTENGYLFDLRTEVSDPEKPLDLQVAVRNAFPARMEFAEWVQRRDSLLAAAAAQAPADAS